MSKFDVKVETKYSPPDKNENYCQTCNKNIIGSSYKFKCHLYKHKAIKSRFICKHCPKEFYRSDTYRRHLSKHTGKYQNIYVCDYCDRNFVDKRNLINHLKIHDDSFFQHPFLKDKRTYRCVACNVTYAEERCLKYHVRRVHFNLIPNEPVFINKPLNETWVESVCNSNVCVQVKKLNNNVITIKKCKDIKKEELEDTPRKKFAKYLKKLEEKDTTQYSKATCDYCKKEMLKKSLRQHIKERHLKIRKFKCDTCNKSFSRHYQLVDHSCGKQIRRRKRLIKAQE